MLASALNNAFATIWLRSGDGPQPEFGPKIRLTLFLRRIIVIAIPALRRASFGDSPVGRSRERLPAALVCRQPRGRSPLPKYLLSRRKGGSEKCRGGAPRGETSRSQGTSRRLASVLACLTSTQGCSQHPASLGAPLPLARPQVGRKREELKPLRRGRAPQNKRPAELCRHVHAAMPRRVDNGFRRGIGFMFPTRKFGEVSNE